MQHFPADKSVDETILLILHNWKVYSGQLSSKGYVSKQNQELENIFTSCSQLKDYLKNNPKELKKGKTSKINNGKV